MYRVCCVIAGVVLFLPIWVFAQPSPYPGAGTLAALKGSSRPLLIFYPQPPGQRPPGASLQLQRSMIEDHRAELEDRRVVPLYVPLAARAEDAPAGTLRDLRTRFHVDGKRFTVVLLGEDGEEKFRSHVPVTIEKLDALIDAMPMRQQEVRDGRH